MYIGRTNVKLIFNSNKKIKLKNTLIYILLINIYSFETPKGIKPGGKKNYRAPSLRRS